MDPVRHTAVGEVARRLAALERGETAGFSPEVLTAAVGGPLMPAQPRWPNHFSETVGRAFRERYQDVLRVTGYGD